MFTADILGAPNVIGKSAQGANAAGVNAFTKAIETVQAFEKKASADTVSLSDKARAYLAQAVAAEEQATEETAETTANSKAAGTSGNTIDIETARAEMKRAEAEGDAYRDLVKCVQIFSRIAGGDNVPQKDEDFLLEKEPEMFMKAHLLRQNKENPTDYDTLIEEEKEEVQTDQPQAEAPPQDAELSSGKAEQAPAENSGEEAPSAEK